MATTEPDKRPPRPSSSNRQRLIQYFFFGVFLLLLWQLARILSPFFVAILGASILALIFYPMHQRIAGRLQDYPGAAAGATTSLVVLIVVVPILLVGWVSLKETPKVYPAAKAWIETVRQYETGASPMPEQLHPILDGISNFLQFWNIDLQDILLKNLDELSANMSHITTTAIKNVVFVGFNLAVLAVALFFFLRDGPSIIRRVVELIPMPEQHKQTILERIQDTLYAVIRGMLVMAVVQGLLTGIGFALFGVPFPVFLGVLATFLSPIPIIGTAVIWVPVAVGMASSGAIWQAAGVFVWCFVVVHSVDALLRPQLIGSKAKIPFLLLFLALLGGMRAYGFSGLLIGPLIVALVLAFINIYRQEYQWLLQPPEKP